MSEKITMRTPFPAHQIGKLAKGSKAQTQCAANEKANCAVCGGWHHPKMIHLDYVGHAALTDRLLDVDPDWVWEPLAFRDGLPAFDSTGGLWIKLTVSGTTRLGYGNAPTSEYKEVGSREKEVIGDALRNAAMRFGAALDLWHKGDLHLPDGEPVADVEERELIDNTKKVNMIVVDNMVAEAVRLVDADGEGEGGMEESRRAAHAIVATLTNDEKMVFQDRLKAMPAGKSTYAGLFKKHYTYEPDTSAP